LLKDISHNLQQKCRLLVKKEIEFEFQLTSPIEIVANGISDQPYVKDIKLQEIILLAL